MCYQKYSLKWNNYQSNITNVFENLLKDERFVDVTLACNEVLFKAHKVILSASSTLFQSVLAENPCQHPTLILPQDINAHDLQILLDFIYKGEIDIEAKKLDDVLKTAEKLKIKGLCESPVPDTIPTVTDIKSEGEAISPLSNDNIHLLKSRKRERSKTSSPVDLRCNGDIPPPSKHIKNAPSEHSNDSTMTSDPPIQETQNEPVSTICDEIKKEKTETIPIASSSVENIIKVSNP